MTEEVERSSRWNLLAEAMRDTKASGIAVRVIGSLMMDGVRRTDEDIHQECRRQRVYGGNLAAVQHARLALEKAGFIEYAGQFKFTPRGGKSQVWQWSPEATKEEFDSIWEDPEWHAHVKAEKIIASLQKPKKSKGATAHPDVLPVAPVAKVLTSEAEPVTVDKKKMSRWLNGLHKFCDAAEKNGLETPDVVRELFWWMRQQVTDK